MIIYILKIQGTGKITDHVQMRDENFALIAYFRLNNPETALSECNLADQMDEIVKAAERIPYGKIEKLDI